MTVKEQEIRALWQAVFHDDEQFVGLLFSHLYRDEDALAIEENGWWISALLMLPYRMTLGTSLLDVAYISGAATRSEYRHQGYMSRLLSQALNEMRDRCIPLSALIPAEPWLCDYYATWGYASVFMREEKCCTSTPQFEEASYHRVTPTREELFAFFEKQMLQRSCCMQHTFAHFEVICGDILLEGGAILALADKSERLSALSFVVPRADKVVIKELLTLTPDVEKVMLGDIQTTFPGKTIYLHRPFRGEGEAIPTGMIRIVDVDNVLSVVAKSDKTLQMTIRVNDGQLPHNSGDYILCDGKCLRGPVLSPDYDVDVAGLASLLPGITHLSPYMSLMLD